MDYQPLILPDNNFQVETEVHYPRSFLYRSDQYSQPLVSLTMKITAFIYESFGNPTELEQRDLLSLKSHDCLKEPLVETKRGFVFANAN